MRTTSIVEQLEHRAGLDRLRKHDRVITPSDEVAFVRHVTTDDFAQCRYAGALSHSCEDVTLHASLLALWREEQPRPRPVRKARG